MLDNDANCLQQRHCVREQLVWHVFYLVLLTGAAIVDSQSIKWYGPKSITASIKSLITTLLLLTMLHICKMLSDGFSIRKRRRIRLFNDVLVKFVRFPDSHGDERVSYAQQCAATRHQHRVPRVPK